jgi:hypothetical protein
MFSKFLRYAIGAVPIHIGNRDGISCFGQAQGDRAPDP